MIRHVVLVIVVCLGSALAQEGFGEDEPRAKSASTEPQQVLRTPKRVVPPFIDPKKAGAAAMRQYDRNRDGRVDNEELDKAPSLNAAIVNLDLDNDQAVSAEEVTKRIEAWQATTLGLMGMRVTVTYRGKPLEGATVVFAPEKFLGPNIKPASGKTDQAGVAIMSTKNDAGLPGVAPGLYQVKITKKGTNIPAKYNKKTILGIEVAIDAKDSDTEPVFDLK